MNRESGNSRKYDAALNGPLRPAGLRHINARELYWLLRANSPCSRADLVRLSGLSAPTVSASVEYLEKHGLVSTAGLGESGGGRPPGLLLLNSTCAYAAGLEITATDLQIALADMHGNRVGQWTAQPPAKNTPERIVKALTEGLHSLMKKHAIPKNKLYSVCASVPGITDVMAGKVVSAPHLHNWRNVPLKQLLEDALHVSAVVENDVNLSVLGERMEGAAKGQENFVFLWVGNGVGAGVFVDGKLRRGASGAAGEIGYMRVPGAPGGELSIHATGSLEDAVGRKGIEAKWVRKKGRHKPLAAAEIFALAAEGDADAVEIRDNVAKVLSEVIVNISVLLDPSLIVLGGEIGSSKDLFSAILKQVQSNDFARSKLVASHLSGNAPLMGAIKLALETAEARLLSFVE